MAASPERSWFVVDAIVEMFSCGPAADDAGEGRFDHGGLAGGGESLLRRAAARRRRTGGSAAGSPSNSTIARGQRLALRRAAPAGRSAPAPRTRECLPRWKPPPAGRPPSPPGPTAAGSLPARGAHKGPSAASSSCDVAAMAGPGDRAGDAALLGGRPRAGPAYLPCSSPPTTSRRAFGTAARICGSARTR